MRDETPEEHSEPDCRAEFAAMRPRIRRRWLAAILLFLCAVPYVKLMNLVFPPNLPGADVRLEVIVPYLVLYLLVGLSFYQFRCPNCDKPLHLIYVGRTPVLAKSWVGRSCSNCGARLK